MRILVYGAGVLGCELAHVLLQNKKNDVTLLARGEWKERIDQKGLVIRQWAQRKTTVDRVRTIDVLAPEDFYDLVFVVLQAGQLPDVLPVLKANRSPYFVFVGNDPHAKQVLEAMQRPAVGEIAKINAVSGVMIPTENCFVCKLDLGIGACRLRGIDRLDMYPILGRVGVRVARQAHVLSVQREKRRFQTEVQR